MASMAAFVYFWSSAYEVSGCCGTDTLYPSFLRILATASQPDPSANAPCTRTTFLIVIVVLLCFLALMFRYSCSMARAFRVSFWLTSLPHHPFAYLSGTSAT